MRRHGVNVTLEQIRILFGNLSARFCVCFCLFDGTIDFGLNIGNGKNFGSKDNLRVFWVDVVSLNVRDNERRFKADRIGDDRNIVIYTDSLEGAPPDPFKVD